jgi:acetylornithine/N-succinyldiaminopimelate aminotransferase
MSLEQEHTRFFHTYKRLPLEIERGEGVYLVGKDGRRYLDMFAGIAVNALGYGHEGLIRAIEEQIRRYIHISNYFLQDAQLELAGLLLQDSGFDKVFFGNSGTEVVEGAMKLARKWGAARGKREIVACAGAFHGRTMGALSLMDRPGYRDGFGPFLDRCRSLEFNNPERLREAVGEETAAVILEFIQGEAGILPASEAFVAELMALKERFGFLVIADEIQSGLGRTGSMFAFQHYPVRPDIALLAKPLGGGLPLGAILGSEALSGVLEPGNHGTTFGGNPVACAAGAVLLKALNAGGLMRNVAVVGDRLRSDLADLQQRFPTLVRDVRGRGLMLGVELTIPYEPVVTALREEGVLVNGTAERVVRIVPPLILGEEHVRIATDALHRVLGRISDGEAMK